MKRFLTLILVILSGVIIIVGLQFDFRWNGIVTWGLAFICLLFAAYFTKYIPDAKKKRHGKKH